MVYEPEEALYDSQDRIKMEKTRGNLNAKSYFIFTY